MKRRNFILTTGSTALLAACGGGGGDSTSSSPTVEPPAVESNVVLAWNEVMLAAVRAVRPGPPMVANALKRACKVLLSKGIPFPPFGILDQIGCAAFIECLKIRLLQMFIQMVSLKQLTQMHGREFRLMLFFVNV